MAIISYNYISKKYMKAVPQQLVKKNVTTTCTKYIKTTYTNFNNIQHINNQRNIKYYWQKYWKKSIFNKVT